MAVEVGDDGEYAGGIDSPMFDIDTQRALRGGAGILGFLVLWWLVVTVSTAPRSGFRRGQSIRLGVEPRNDVGSRLCVGGFGHGG